MKNHSEKEMPLNIYKLHRLVAAVSAMFEMEIYLLTKEKATGIIEQLVCLLIYRTRFTSDLP